MLRDRDAVARERVDSRPCTWCRATHTAIRGRCDRSELERQSRSRPDLREGQPNAGAVPRNREQCYLLGERLDMPLGWPGLTQEIDQVFADVVGLQVTLVKKAIAFTASTGGVTKTARPIVFNAVRMTRHDAEQAFGSLLR